MTTGASADPLARYLEFDAAAALLRMSPQTLYRRVADGEVAAIKVGRNSFVAHGEIDDYLARLEKDASQRRARRSASRRKRRHDLPASVS